MCIHIGIHGLAKLCEKLNQEYRSDYLNLEPANMFGSCWNYIVGKVVACSSRYCIAGNTEDTS